MARNRFGFGLGTFGRDAAYTMISMYLIFYLTDVVRVSSGIVLAVTIIMVVARIFDAVSDPFVGVLIDNTKTRFGKFKPWILIGAVLSSGFMLLLFTDLQVSDTTFVILFLVIYIIWGISFTANDVAYWSMLPALSQDQSQREKIGSFARICASLGTFSMVVGIVPITKAIGNLTGSLQMGYFYLALGAAVVLLIFQSITLIFVKEDTSIPTTHERTRFRDLAQIIFRNDQLLAVAIAMTLFVVGYTSTTSLGLYYFKYVYGNVDMYSIFAAVLGVSQIGALVAYPYVAKILSRKQIYTLGMLLVAVGYIVFFFAPTTTMIFIGIAGLCLFVGQALIQMLMLMFIADTVEYGQWKLGRRNESVVLSVQPFIYKVGSALASGVVGATVLLAKTQSLAPGQVLLGNDLVIFKSAMMFLPLFLIAVSFLIYRRFYKIDKEFYESIIADLHTTAQSHDEVPHA